MSECDNERLAREQGFDSYKHFQDWMDGRRMHPSEEKKEREWIGKMNSLARKQGFDSYEDFRRWLYKDTF